MIDGHGDDAYRYARPMRSNFSSNVWAGIDHRALFARLAASLSKVCTYPEPQPLSLERAFAGVLQVTGEEVCVTNGATEAIYLTAQAFRGARSAVWMPTFSEYADACRLHGHTVMPFYTLESLPRTAQLVWLCHPNNPTGEARDFGTLSALIAAHPEKIFIVDQSYERFTLRRTFTAAEGVGYPNLLLFHSLTKHYALPGLRLGYATACRELLRELRLRRMPWSVNSLAIEAGFYAVEEGLRLPVDLPACLAEAERLADRLRATGGVEVWHSDTHFMLASLRCGRAAALKDYLAAEHGLLIRDASNFEGLDGRFFRIAAQTPEENDLLVRAISQWMTSF